MALHWFSPPVPVSGEHSGMIYIVSNVEAASEHLLTWTKRGPKWNQAVRTCMNALADQATPQEARRCFRLAAIEAGKLRPPHEGDD
ncbi:DUF982 domain-containing protein [Mesorhizobium sp. B2-4-9]|uniref:DUF982 domain-containing protein n=1 Tax=Mesorhizobium sp. B2-4-9 TaxID=2589940 RepID=UPI00112B98A3|nr:DUF982 domain-containing protein [Mesorhizobium sp. B2-4-9]TPL21102.1 DUF982 domain-containing protein [Mesorhizobium sp. B2-4-9]